jgi:hypothetical protein
MQAQLDKFKQYLLDNLTEVNEVDIVELDEKTKANQSSFGIVGHTHGFICKFENGWHPVSMNANKKSTRGWKGIVSFINKSHEKLFKKIVKEQSIKL